MLWSCSGVASVSRINLSRILLNPTGASFETPSVPRKSRSPSALTMASLTSTPMAVETARNVTPAQATSASSSKSPEHACIPLPPVAGCKPASTNAFPVSTLHEMPSPIFPSALSVIMAVSGCSRYFSFNGAWRFRNSSDCINQFSQYVLEFYFVGSKIKSNFTFLKEEIKLPQNKTESIDRVNSLRLLCRSSGRTDHPGNQINGVNGEASFFCMLSQYVFILCFVDTEY